MLTTLFGGLSVLFGSLGLGRVIFVLALRESLSYFSRDEGINTGIWLASFGATFVVFALICLNRGV